MSDPTTLFEKPGRCHAMTYARCALPEDHLGVHLPIESAAPETIGVRAVAPAGAPSEPGDLPIEVRQEFRDAVQTLSNARRAEAWDVLFKAVRWALSGAAAPRDAATVGPPAP